jgi:hypothetical protein
MPVIDAPHATPATAMKRWISAVAVLSCSLAQGIQHQAMAANETGLVQNAAKSAGLGPSGKRVGPAQIAPVTIGNKRFEVVHWARDRGLAQNGGYIAALDISSGKELWLLRVYETTYDKSLERDVQDVFIKSMSKKIFSETLKITDENGHSYLVNTQTRVVTPD